MNGNGNTIRKYSADFSGNSDPDNDLDLQPKAGTWGLHVVLKNGNMPPRIYDKFSKGLGIRSGHEIQRSLYLDW